MLNILLLRFVLPFLTKRMNNKHKTSMKLVKSKCLKIHEEIKDEGEETSEDISIFNFRCPKCGKVFSKEDNLNYPKEKGQKWCSLSTILSYGEQEYGMVQP